MSSKPEIASLAKDPASEAFTVCDAAEFGGETDPTPDGVVMMDNDGKMFDSKSTVGGEEVIYLVGAVFPCYPPLPSFGSASGAGHLRAFCHITLCISIH